MVPPSYRQFLSHLTEENQLIYTNTCLKGGISDSCLDGLMILGFSGFVVLQDISLWVRICWINVSRLSGFDLSPLRNLILGSDFVGLMVLVLLDCWFSKVVF